MPARRIDDNSQRINNVKKCQDRLNRNARVPTTAFCLAFLQGRKPLQPITTVTPTTQIFTTLTSTKFITNLITTQTRQSDYVTNFQIQPKVTRSVTNIQSIYPTVTQTQTEYSTEVDQVTITSTKPQVTEYITETETIVPTTTDTRTDSITQDIDLTVTVE